MDKQQKKKKMEHLVGGSNIFFSFSVQFECNFQNQNFHLIFLSIPNTKHNFFTISRKMYEHLLCNSRGLFIVINRSFQ